ncbi:hypothetical protein MRB53_013994 [Persea americana]|uniref:Uncharacterized protein n=1 Tax=Persea americana TaxID=3435 RepID=A0ACC2K9S5_PERAE|nr:hypothetical protein MRB53_013994 [Persea americana]
MAQIEALVVCILIIVIDIVAGILGIEAEIAQNKEKHLKYLIFECRAPSSQAFRLGLAAAGLLALAHIVGNLLGGCQCICSRQEYERSSANKQLAVACLIISWIVLAIGLGMLVIGALANSKSRSKCGFSHRNFLAIGGILCFIHGLFCVPYYVSATASFRELRKAGRAGGGGVGPR